MPTNKKTIEQKTAETLLQRPMMVEVGGKQYSVAPPSIATLVLVSEELSHAPSLELDREDIALECLREAKECRFLGDIAAILILGAKRIQSPRKRLLSRLVARLRPSEQKALAREILEDYSPSQLRTLITTLLQGLELGDFFALTTFLTQASILKPTRRGKEVSKTIVSGQ